MPGRTRTTLCALLACAFVIGLAYYSVVALNPPHALPKDAPLDQFSAHRAIEHAFACSMQPHPAGSKNDEHVAQYLLKTLKEMGVEAEYVVKPAIHGNDVELQKTVIGRIPGTDNTGAIAFSAHYDSVPYGPGATDDIAGCIAMLETARAFMHQPRMRNDLLFVFADAEEVGGYGASGFCSHPLAKKIGVMTELDVRGTKGPSLVYELSPGNGPLISELRKARREGALPISSSLMYAVYQASPFGSDFVRYRDAGMKGYSLAYIDKFMWYHTANDSPEHVDPDSIQHFGAHSMGIARHFGNADFGTLNLRGSDDIYFNTVGFNMVQYPMWMGKPLAWAAIAVLALAIILGLATKRITVGGYVLSLLLFPLAALISALVATAFFCAAFGFKNVVYLYTVKLTYIPEPRALYDGNLYCYAIGLMTIALAGGLYWLASRRLRAENLYAAGLTWLCPVLVATAVYLTGGSYLFMWPVLFGGIGLALLFFGSREEGPNAFLLLLATLFAAPALCLLTPGWQQMMWMINILGSPILAILIVLIILNAMPAVVLLGRVRLAWMAWPVIAGAGLIVLVVGLTIGKPSKDRPLMDCVVYAANLDTQKAFWMSEDVNVDEWTQQFFPDGTRGPIEDILPGKQGERFLRAPAPVAANLTGIRCQVLKDEAVDGKRFVTCKLTTDDAPFEVDLRQKQGPKITGVTLGTVPITGISSPLSLHFRLFAQDGYEVTFETTPTEPGSPGAPLAFEASSTAYGFPQIPGIKPRPEYIVTETNIMRNGISLRGEHIYVKNTFNL